MIFPTEYELVVGPPGLDAAEDLINPIYCLRAGLLTRRGTSPPA